MLNMKISIILPVYNTEKYLEKCLDSLVNQSYKDIEIVCVNDGSTDQSLIILEKYALEDTRIVIVNKENGGLSSARNAGLEVIHGEYVMFVDSDDWIDTDTCEKALNAALSINADVVLWSYIREYPDKSLITPLFNNEKKVWMENEVSLLHRRMVGLTGNELSDPSKGDSIITAWGKLYRREILEKQWFVDTKIIGTEDALFNISVFFNAKKVVFIPDTHYHYFKSNTSSLTKGNYKPKLVMQWKTLYQMIGKLLDEHKSTWDFYVALNNRKVLGIMQLGLAISSDQSMRFGEKVKELNRILNMEHYKSAIKELQISSMPIHWKLFFVFVKWRFGTGLLLLLGAMNRLRSKI